jgi:hypothetical protein
MDTPTLALLPPMMQRDVGGPTIQEQQIATRSAATGNSAILGTSC